MELLAALFLTLSVQAFAGNCESEAREYVTNRMYGLSYYGTQEINGQFYYQFLGGGCVFSVHYPNNDCHLEPETGTMCAL